LGQYSFSCLLILIGQFKFIACQPYASCGQGDKDGKGSRSENIEKVCEGGMGDHSGMVGVGNKGHEGGRGN